MTFLMEMVNALSEDSLNLSLLIRVKCDGSQTLPVRNFHNECVCIY